MFCSKHISVKRHSVCFPETEKRCRIFFSFEFIRFSNRGVLSAASCTVSVSTIFFILKQYKQGYMFRLKVSHLQAYTIFSLPDAFSTLGSHSVYNCGTHLIETF